MAESATNGHGRRYSGRDAAERTHARRTALLDAALELFATQGHATTPVKQICKQAGLTERYFYESFRDRHDCLANLYSELARRLRDATTGAIDRAGGSDVDTVIRDALSAFVTHLTANPCSARVILVEVVGASAELEEQRHAVLREFVEITLSVWSGRAEPVASTDPKRLVAVGLVGAVNHLLVDWLHRGRVETPAELTDACVTLFSAARERLTAPE